MLQFFGYLSALFSLFSYVPYVRDIFLQKAKPERASWLIWTVLVFIQFFSQLSKGAHWSLLLSGSQLIGITLIFVLSLKFGYGNLRKKDYVGLLIAGLGLILWYLTKEAALALWITIGVDMVGVVLTVEKAYQEPQTEPPAMWAMNFFAGLFASLAVGSFNVILLSYPIYTVFLNVAVLSALFLGSRRLVKIKVLK